MRAQKAVIGMFVLFAGAAGVTQVAHGTSAPGEEPAPFSASNQRAEITAIQPSQSKSFAAFRRPRTAADVIPQEVRGLLTETAVTGKNVDLSRSVTSTAGTAWIIPGDNAVCIALPDPTEVVGVGCATTDYAAAYGSLATLYDPKRPSSKLVGLLLPDGGSASVRYADGKTVALPRNADGAVLAQVSGAISITIDGPGGTRTVPLEQEGR